MEFVQIRKRHFFSIGEKTGYEESIWEWLSHPIQCLQPEGTVGLYIIHAQSLSEIGLFLAFQHNYFTAVELQHSFRAIGAVLIGQKHFFYRIFKFGGNGFAIEVGGDENAL